MLALFSRILGLPCPQQLREPDTDIGKNGAPVLQVSVQIVGNRLEAVERDIVHLAEPGYGVGLHVKKVVLLRKLLHLLRAEGLGAHDRPKARCHHAQARSRR